MATSLSSQRLACGDLLLGQPLSVTGLMEARSDLAASDEGPLLSDDDRPAARQQLSRQSTSRSRIHLSMRAWSSWES
jgi:hypothetical protein